jgi:hypothetical protein
LRNLLRLGNASSKDGGDTHSKASNAKPKALWIPRPISEQLAPDLYITYENAPSDESSLCKSNYQE